MCVRCVFWKPSWTNSFWWLLQYVTYNRHTTRRVQGYVMMSLCMRKDAFETSFLIYKLYHQKRLSHGGIHIHTIPITWISKIPNYFLLKLYIFPLGSFSLVAYYSWCGKTTSTSFLFLLLLVDERSRLQHTVVYFLRYPDMIIVRLGWGGENFDSTTQQRITVGDGDYEWCFAHFLPAKKVNTKKKLTRCWLETTTTTDHNIHATTWQDGMCMCLCHFCVRVKKLGFNV